MQQDNENNPASLVNRVDSMPQSGKKPPPLYSSPAEQMIEQDAKSNFHQKRRIPSTAETLLKIFAGLVAAFFLLVLAVAILLMSICGP